LLPHLQMPRLSCVPFSTGRPFATRMDSKSGLLLKPMKSCMSSFVFCSIRILLFFRCSYIGLHGDIVAKYHVYRSFHRASNSRAISKEVALADIRVVTRWQKVKKAKGQHSLYDMTQHNADRRRPTSLRWT
jgi:hypothetical protein